MGPLNSLRTNFKSEVIKMMRIVTYTDQREGQIFMTSHLTRHVTTDAATNQKRRHLMFRIMSTQCS